MYFYTSFQRYNCGDCKKLKIIKFKSVAINIVILIYINL